MNRYKDEGASSSSTSQSSQQTETDDDRMIAIVLSEEYANMDNAVAKRLSSLSSIPVTNPSPYPSPSFSLSIRYCSRFTCRVADVGGYGFCSMCLA